MDKKEAKKRIEKLKKEIDYHRYLYHVKDQEEISEAALDSLKNELFKLEQDFPELITPDSPTQRVAGEALEKFKKVEHSERMISLFDAFSEQDMEDWEGRLLKILNNNDATSPQPPSRRGTTNNPPSGGGAPIGAGEVASVLNYFCELKLDGLAMNLRYKKGEFKQGATRGDGLVGEDVTSNLRTIESIPLKLRVPSKAELKKNGFSDEQGDNVLEQIEKGTIHVRGEAVMTKAVFEKLNKKYKKIGKPELKNQRNGAAGSIRQLDPKLAAERELDFYVYSVILEPAVETQSIASLQTHEQEIILARLLGFKSLKDNKFCKNLSEVFAFHQHWEKSKDKLPMLVDGVVVKVNNLSLWPVLGVVGKGPRYMMAYKFAAEQVTTKLKEVNWQVGRTGILTPTALLEPVDVGGVTVTHATLHNMDEIERLGLKIGDTVILERAGDVIPKIIKVMDKLRDGKEKAINIPKKCPMCSSAVERVKDEVAYRCTNNECYAVNLRRLIHWAAKGAMDIEGLGEKIVEQLIKEGLVHDVADFYTLTEGDLKPLERFADKSAENLVKAIAEKKNIPLHRFLIGLSIKHVGEETAIMISKKLKVKSHKVSELLKAMQKVSLAQWEEMEDLGPIMAKSLYSWFQKKKNVELLEKLEECGVIIDVPQKSPPSEGGRGEVFKDQTIIVTGTLKSLTRSEAKAKIRELGGKPGSQVSKKTDLVVVGENPGSKAEKAKELGVRVVDEEAFLEMM